MHACRGQLAACSGMRKRSWLGGWLQVKRFVTWLQVERPATWCILQASLRVCRFLRSMRARANLVFCVASRRCAATAGAALC